MCTPLYLYSDVVGSGMVCLRRLRLQFTSELRPIVGRRGGRLPAGVRPVPRSAGESRVQAHRREHQVLRGPVHWGSGIAGQPGRQVTN